MIVRFTIPGEPKAKARPRMSTKTGKAYTPNDTLNYEGLVKWIYQSQDHPKLNGEIEAKILAFYSIPKSMTKKNRKLIEEDKLHPTKKPDLDNIAKIVLDSLNGLAYTDDSQVVKLVLEKYYSDNPRVEVTLYEIEN